MKITIQKYDELIGFKIDIMNLSREERIKLENIQRDSFLQRLHQIFQQYFEIDEKYKSGMMAYHDKDEKHDELFHQSGYEDVYDFLLDYERWKHGLPIYIKFRLI